MSLTVEKVYQHAATIRQAFFEAMPPCLDITITPFDEVPDAEREAWVKVFVVASLLVVERDVRETLEEMEAEIKAALLERKGGAV